MQNLHIQLSDPVYAAIQEAATASGLSVEAMVARQLVADFGNDVGNDFFTPEILAEIDAAREEAKLGGSVSLDEMRERRLAKSKAWRESHHA